MPQKKGDTPKSITLFNLSIPPYFTGEFVL